MTIEAKLLSHDLRVTYEPTIVDGVISFRQDTIKKLQEDAERLNDPSVQSVDIDQGVVTRKNITLEHIRLLEGDIINFSELARAAIGSIEGHDRFEEGTSTVLQKIEGRIEKLREERFRVRDGNQRYYELSSVGNSLSIAQQHLGDIIDGRNPPPLPVGAIRVAIIKGSTNGSSFTYS